MSARLPTMQTIAREVGCSVMTVSLALRNHPRISLRTREQVRAVALRLNYRPNPMVATLMTHLRSVRPTTYQSNLAFLAPRSNAKQRWIGGDVVGGIRERADELGFLVDTFWLDDFSPHPGSLEKILRSRNIQGVIVAPLPERSSIDWLDWSDWSAVALGNSMLSPRIHRVTHHQFHGMMLMHDVLLAKGHRRIGLAIEPHVDDKVDRNWSACAAGFQLRRPLHDRVPVLLSAMTVKNVMAWVEKHKPTAVIGHDGLLDCLRRGGMEAPRDLSFAHVNVPPLPSAKSNLSGLNQNWPLAGAETVNSIFAQLQRNERGVPAHPKTVMIEGCWVEGETTRDFAGK